MNFDEAKKLAGWEDAPQTINPTARTPEIIREFDALLIELDNFEIAVASLLDRLARYTAPVSKIGLVTDQPEATTEFGGSLRRLSNRARINTENVRNFLNNLGL